MFRIDRCSFGITYKDKDYSLGHIDSWTAEDPNKKHLTRGANRVSTRGLIYSEGGKSPITITVSLVGVESQLANLLNDLFNKEERFNAFAIDGTTGDSAFANNCIVTGAVRQSTISEGEDSMNIEVVFETFDLDERLK